MDSRFESAGSYTTDRAAALSGVPRSTVHDWAWHGILVPSVSSARVKLWSFRDLLSLRLVYWLRHPQIAIKNPERSPSTMKTVRAALKQLEELDMAIFDEEHYPTVLVDRFGVIRLGAQNVIEDTLDLIQPFEGAPHLLSPSNFVRIRPRKLSGAPHVIDTRIESEALHTLQLRGFTAAGIQRLYPSLSEEKIEDALALENRLARSLL
jgi:uncharacterized protein (DUF433 family)